MSRVTIRFLSVCWLLLILALLLVVASVPASPRAQQGKAAPANDEEQEPQPRFVEFKGVRIGMSADEARNKLGTPRDKSDELDLYVFNEKQAVQVVYDKSRMVSAISIDFMGGADAPPAKDVLGGDIQAKTDGSLYKIIRYPKAGYWVSYSRTAGDSPLVSITIQKIEK